jgi:hypothetical protein
MEILLNFKVRYLIKDLTNNKRVHMRFYRKELWFSDPSCRGFVNITSQVEEAVHERKIQD